MCEGWAVMLQWGRISCGDFGLSLTKIRSFSVPCWWSEPLETVTSSVGTTVGYIMCIITGFYRNSTNSWPLKVSRKVHNILKVSEPGCTLHFLLMIGNLALSDISNFALLILNIMVLIITLVFVAHIFTTHARTFAIPLFPSLWSISYSSFKTHVLLRP